MEKRLHTYHADCTKKLLEIEDNSIDVILTDPPYLYLKGQKLEKEFDEDLFFSQAKRVLKKGGFVVIFGRGVSFYRWNTILASLGFNFKEEIIWNKSYSTSPLLPIGRVHETISIWSNGNGKINKVKVPYLEIKGDDIPAICQDIKRMRSVLSNPKSLQAVQTFLENNNCLDERINKNYDEIKRMTKYEISCSNKVTTQDRCVNVIQSMQFGMNERSIIKNYEEESTSIKNVTRAKQQEQNRCTNVIQSMEFGMNEKTIIKQPREHYKTIHPTQKPVRLLERLLALVSKEGDTVLDPFMGSGSTGIACLNTQRRFIGIELDDEYYNLAYNCLSTHNN